MTLKVVGKARAKAKGFYPLPDGQPRIVNEGEVFDIVEGHTKGKWFEPIKPGKAEAKEPKPEDLA